MKTILVVDDDAMNLKMAEFILKQKDYGVIKALSGMEALEILQNEEVDLILLDIEMPVMGGFQTYEKIRENPASQNIPVAFLSASSEEEVIEKAFHMGAVDYIKKPFMPKDLQDHVADIF